MEVGARLVLLVDEHHPRDAQRRAASPRRLGADLDAVDGADDENGEVGDGEGGIDLAGEVGVAGRVEEVDLVGLARGSVAFHSNGATATESDILRLISSGSVSHTVVPSSVLPARGSTPARCSSASASVVLPLPLWPTRATFRIRSVVGAFNVSFPLVHRGTLLAGRSRHAWRLGLPNVWRCSTQAATQHHRLRESPTSLRSTASASSPSCSCCCITPGSAGCRAATSASRCSSRVSGFLITSLALAEHGRSPGASTSAPSTGRRLRRIVPGEPRLPRRRDGRRLVAPVRRHHRTAPRPVGAVARPGLQLDAARSTVGSLRQRDRQGRRPAGRSGRRRRCHPSRASARPSARRRAPSPARRRLLGACAAAAPTIVGPASASRIIRDRSAAHRLGLIEAGSTPRVRCAWPRARHASVGSVQRATAPIQSSPSSCVDRPAATSKAGREPGARRVSRARRIRRRAATTAIESARGEDADGSVSAPGSR